MSGAIEQTPRFELRPATAGDLEFAWSLYRELMKPLTLELLAWNELGQRRTVEEALAQQGASVIVIRDAKCGWLYVSETPDEIYLGQLYLTPSWQGQGIGGTIVRHLSDRAQQSGKCFTLSVMKNNRAQVLYERLGFRVVATSEYKLKMQWFATR
jgi:ribosomal protein S18 acetylase RimI-like enzyme